jgi:hypothetical protein
MCELDAAIVWSGASASGGRCRPPPRRNLARPEARRALPGYDAIEARCAIRSRPGDRPQVAKVYGVAVGMIKGILRKASRRFLRGRERRTAPAGPTPPCSACGRLAELGIERGVHRLDQIALHSRGLVLGGREPGWRFGTGCPNYPKDGRRRFHLRSICRNSARASGSYDTVGAG